jgi:DNA-binding NarL/FixJ family response regulator
LRDTAPIRVLLVDDYEQWRRFACSTLQKDPDLQINGEVSDGLEAVAQAQQLQPDLILLDIGLPTLNGIEAARRIGKVSPISKILFVSENRSPEIVEKALNTGAGGYVVKSDAASELLPAVRAVLEGDRFVSASLALHDLTEPTEDQVDSPQRKEVVTPFRLQKKIRHEVEFYADDTGFVDGFARFIEAALKEGKAVIVVATDSHRASLLQRLTVDGLNMPAEIEQGNYIPLEVTKTLSSFMVNNSPDPVMFRKVAGDLIMKAARGVKRERRQVAFCGEGVHILLAACNLEATIRLERMWNEIGTHYELDLLFGYFRSDFATEEDISTLERVCAEHSAVYGRERC